MGSWVPRFPRKHILVRSKIAVQVRHLLACGRLDAWGTDVNDSKAVEPFSFGRCLQSFKLPKHTLAQSGVSHFWLLRSDQDRNSFRSAARCRPDEKVTRLV